MPRDSVAARRRATAPVSPGSVRPWFTVRSDADHRHWVHFDFMRRVALVRRNGDVRAEITLANRWAVYIDQAEDPEAIDRLEVLLRGSV